MRQLTPVQADRLAPTPHAQLAAAAFGLAAPDSRTSRGAAAAAGVRVGHRLRVQEAPAEHRLHRLPGLWQPGGRCRDVCAVAPGAWPLQLTPPRRCWLRHCRPGGAARHLPSSAMHVCWAASMDRGAPCCVHARSCSVFRATHDWTWPLCAGAPCNAADVPCFQAGVASAAWLLRSSGQPAATGLDKVGQVHQPARPVAGVGQSSSSRCSCQC